MKDAEQANSHGQRSLCGGALKYYLTAFFACAALAVFADGHSPDDLGPYTFEQLQTLPLLDEGTVYGDKIRRTMHLLASSTEARPNKVKILFFGQSITRQDYSRKIIEAKLRERYPHAQLEVMNRAIGGYQAPMLLPTMLQNLIPLQPDLIVFHVYGGEGGGYEAILKTIRHTTTAEVVTITHHLDNYNEAKKQRRDNASILRRELAQKYGCELVEVRHAWQSYLDMHSLDVVQLLADKIHHNAHGGELWGALQARHFEVQPADPINWQDTISRIDTSETTQSMLGHLKYDEQEWIRDAQGLHTSKQGARLKVNFEGTRLDLISFEGEGIAEILVDGRKSSAMARTWAATQPSKTPIDYRPAIRKVGLGAQPVAETWTLTADHISEDGQEFSYSLEGTVSGFQGRGDHTAAFVSNNGVIHLSPEHFTWDHAIKIKKKPIPVPAQTSWDVYATSPDTWHCGGASGSHPSGQVTLVQQLENREHTVEIILRSGSISVSEVLIYKPAL
jgi:hypothetical protein